ncbi:lycopene cyclase family protein [Corynebacterium mendelii]|uniref:Lycopene cyclase n=1 Tax=Corynebacterium mendelii TaxID=2765362 RepID=A0A939IXA2_9CORY|nr:lycopene cyclase family protein [Corynebacterium mendelii]MBN9643462.1 hypothetical protein [Corynebacterium mendelii]
MTDSTTTLPAAVDVIVLGAGPAGRTLAHRAAARGWRVLAVDPVTQWTNTYGIFADELPDWLDESVFSTVNRAIVIGRNWLHPLDRKYGIVDNERLRRALGGFRVVHAHARVTGQHSVDISGTTVTAPVIADARGLPLSPGCARQVARGVFTDPSERDPFTSAAGTQPVWMDLTQVAADSTIPPSFGYTMQVGGKLLVEETVLATRHPVEPGDLADRLAERLGYTPTDETTEDVVIALTGHVDSPATVCFGARAGLVNPVTGYSLAAALNNVDRVLDALRPVFAGKPPGRMPWQEPAWRVDRLLTDNALNVLCAFNGAELSDFLEPVFTLDSRAQKRFFTLGDPVGTITGMIRVFSGADYRLKRTIMREFFRSRG